MPANRVSFKPPFPPFAVTGVGSLSHRDIIESLIINLWQNNTPYIPFVPQFPQVHPHEQMLAQVLTPFKHLLHTANHHWAYHLTPQNLSPFLHELALFQPNPKDLDGMHGLGMLRRALLQGALPHASLIKIQLVGLMTLASSISFQQQTAYYNPQLLAGLADYLQGWAGWLIKQLSGFGIPILFVWDEPVFPPPDAPEIFSHFYSALQNSQHHIGIHTCGAFRMADILAWGCDYISFDAGQYLSHFWGAGEGLKFIERGGWVAFGLVPTLGQVHFADNIVHNFLQTMPPLLTLKDIAPQSIITASCGLGTLDIVDAQLRWALCQEVAQKLWALKK